LGRNLLKLWPAATTKAGNEFEKIAVFGHKKWQKTAANLSGRFVSGKNPFV
jgi:hypothetical protein